MPIRATLETVRARFAPVLALESFRDAADHRRFLARHGEALRARGDVERALARRGEAFTVTARCYVCRRRVALRVDMQHAYPVEGVLTPNWRERLACPRCGLNNRMRATIHLLGEVVAPPPAARVYLTEQLTPLFAWARRRYPGACGSEYLGDALPLGATDARGLRNEDLTRLTFPDGAFDLVVSLDVLEHVPDYLAGLRECLRVLAPGGDLLLTCPFDPDDERNLVRAVLRSDGTIEHREPPEYHGNPVDPAGALAFYRFGWELLDQLRATGFEEVRALQYWSRHHGYLGPDQLVFLARRPAVG